MAQLQFNAAVGVRYSHYAGAVTTQIIKASPGLLDGIMLNASTTTCLLYDSATAAGAGAGTLIASITPANFIYPGGITYSLNFNNGLVITTTGGSADVTVMYR